MNLWKLSMKKLRKNVIYSFLKINIEEMLAPPKQKTGNN